MITISHRGNLNGPSELENSPNQIDKCIQLDMDCEIDIRIVDGLFFLGHDIPQYEVHYEWLLSRSEKLWLHCKNIEALSFFNDKKAFHYFWHENDSYTITSKGYIWGYPGKPLTKNCIAVLPELWAEMKNFKDFEYFGICSDFVSDKNASTSAPIKNYHRNFRIN